MSGAGRRRGWARSPRRILAAVDFSEGSLVALRSGRAVVGENAVLVLAYVNPMNGFLADEGEATIHDLGVQAGFLKLSQSSATRTAFDHVVLHTAPPQSRAGAARVRTRSGAI